jgi:L-ascorbate metabolism protein UlaG (beta-lactamase superfamily)
VLLSHNHYDHFDMSTLVRLAREHDPTFVTGLGNAALLEAEGIARVVELDWWECEPLAAGVCVTAVPAQHFSMRGACDRDATLWAGFVVEGTAGAAYFAGDTGFGPHFAQIRERFGPVRLALLPIGAYLPRWIMAPVHMSPEEAVRAHGVLGASTSVGMHFGTFRQTDEGIDEPMHDLARAVGAAGEPRPRFWVLGFGQGRAVPGVGAPESAVGSWLR